MASQFAAAVAHVLFGFLSIYINGLISSPSGKAHFPKI
jgi:hypothetical protein